MIGFEARYPGTCATGNDPIKVGDPIEETDDGYAHVDCLPRAPEGPPCTSCWLVHAGECL